MASRRVGVFLSFLVVLHSSAWAQSASIVGVVKDTTGAALPGVTVTAESAALIERLKTVVTGASGEYRIVDLRPGSYAVTFSLPGFKRLRHEGVQLSTGFTATVNAQLALGGIEETVTVTGESPLVDVRGSVSETTLKQELLEGVPVGRNSYQVALLMPGATTTSPDVGGNQIAQITNLSVHGSAGVDITWSADGLDITGNNVRGGLTATYYNEGFNQEVSIQTKALPAEISSGGVNMNMVKKQGGNSFTGDLHLSFTDQQFQSGNVDDEQRALGLTFPSAMDRAYDVNGTVAGPISRDKLWFAAGFRRWRVDRLVANTLNVDGTQALDEQLLSNFSGSVTYQATKANRVSLFVELMDKIRGHRRDRTSTYQFISPEASWRQPNKGPTIALKWTSTLRKNLLLEAGVGLMNVRWSLDYQPELGADALSRNDLSLSTLTGAAPNSLTREDVWRRQTTFVLSWLPSWKGSHNFRVGGQYGLPMPYPQDRATLGRDLVAQYRNGVPDSVLVYNTPVNARVTMWEHALFAQDAWTINNRLTINAGVRFDLFRGQVDEQTSPAGTFVPARHFDKISDVPNWKNVVPRLAFVYDITGKGRTAIKANVSKYMRREAAGFMGLVNPMRLNSEVRTWADANRDGIPQLAEIGPGRGTLTSGATVRLAPDLQRPFQWEYTATLEHQFTKTLAVSVGYYHRKYYDLFTTVNVALSPADYTPVTITNPLTGSPFTVFNQNPATVGRVENVLKNVDGIGSWYDGVELTFQKRMANRFMLFGGLTVGSNKDCADGAASSNPNDRINACGYASFDSKYMANLSGMYELPFGFKLSGHVQYVSGQPLGTRYIVTRADVPNLTQVNQTVAVLPIGDRRKPDWTLLDVRVSKAFRVGRVTFEPMLDLFNMLNENASLTQVETLGSAFGRISANVDGRLVRVGLKVNF